MLQRGLDRPRAEVRLALATRPKAGVRAHQRAALTAGLRPHRVVEDRAGGNVQRLGQPGDRLRWRGGEILGDETEPSQGAQLNRDTELPGRTVLTTHELEIVLVKPEVLDEHARLDRLREPLQPLDLDVGEEPARGHRSVPI